MRLIWKHKRTTFFTDKRTNIKVKIKKYWLSRAVK